MLQAENRIAAVVGVGSIGSELANQLVENGREVRALMRNPQSYTSDSPYITPVRADITDDVALCNAFEGVNEVYVTAADFSHGPNYGKGFERARRINEEGIAKVADAATIQGVEAVVLFSSEAVYGVQDRVDENSPTLSTGTYGATKRLGEIALFKDDSPVKRSVIRPVSVLGPGADKWSGLLYRRIANGEFMGLSDGSNSFNFVDIRDVAGAAIAIAEDDATDGEVYNLAADQSIRMNALLEIFAGLADRDPKYVPALLAIAGAKIAEVLSARTDLHIPIDTQMVRTGLCKVRKVSNEKIKEEIGYTFIDPAQTIFDSLAWANTEYNLQKDAYLEFLQPDFIRTLLD